MNTAIELGEIKTDLKYAKVSVVDESASKTCDITEHSMPHDKLAAFLGTDLEKGLETKVFEERIKLGFNEITPKEGVWWFWKFFKHVAGGFSILLWVGSILCFIVYGLTPEDPSNLTLGIVLAVVVLGTGIFSYSEEVKSDNVLDALLKMSPSMCYVKRDNEWKLINARFLVKGDIVKIENGKKVPADVIILSTVGIKVDNSSLTGEPEPLKRSVECTDPEKATESKNIAFFGTNCVEGSGTGIVVRTGDHTTMGKIAQSVLQTTKPEALMVHEIENFVKIISIIAFGIGIAFFIASVVLKYKILDSIIFTIGIIVANVPEGLLATVTVALTITAKRLAKKNVLVRSTLVVETLGSVTCIASDKTGTLTQNRMSVRNAIFSDGTIRVSKHPRRRSALDLRTKEDAAPVTISDVDEALRPYYYNLVEIAAICNHAHFDNREGDIQIRKTDGDASESALLKFAHSNSNADILRQSFPEIACVPFNSTNKFMISIHRITGSSDYRVCLKGAPERILSRCNTYTDTEDSVVKPLTETALNAINESNIKLAKNGERVLGFAEQILKGYPENFEFKTEDIKDVNFPMDGFRFVGMLSLEDPPREAVPGAVKSCHEANVLVIMVTGDHPLTGRSIAAQIGILSEADGGQNTPLYDLKLSKEVRNDERNTGVVVTGDQLAHLDDADWKYILSRHGIVFARTLPTQKQDIVNRLQDPNGLDHVVAVTGDGVNDSPALKAARVGIAMGSGSEVAKEAADLILLNDDFASIVAGIEEGRLIFANLKKSIAYTLTSNVPEIIPFLAQIAFKLPLGMTTIMILCIDLGTDILPAISFAYEKSESNIMKIPPRDRHKDKLVTGTLVSFSYLQVGIIQTFCAFTVFFNTLNRHGFSTDFILKSKAGIIWERADDWEGQIPCYSNSLVEGGCANYDYRMFALRQAQTAFLTSIVLCQIGCGLACKTRFSSLFEHGMANMVLNWGFIQEIGLIAMLVYIPGLQYAFKTESLVFEDWYVALPFSVFLLIYDELRKLWIRKFPDGMVKRWLQY